MLIVMKPSAAAQEVDAVVNVIHAIGLRPHPMPGATRTAIGITGNTGPVDGRRFENLPGVAEVIRVTKPYKLITLDLRPEKTVVRSWRRHHRRKRTGDHRGTVRDRKPRPGIRGGRSRAAKRCAFLSWRRVETPNVPVRISRSGRERLGNHAEIRRDVWPEDRHRSTRRTSYRSDRTVMATSFKSALATCRTFRSSGELADRNCRSC